MKEIASLIYNALYEYKHNYKSLDVAMQNDKVFLCVDAGNGKQNFVVEVKESFVDEKLKQEIIDLMNFFN